MNDGGCKEMNIISSSYGNDSIALIQWALENDINIFSVVYCDTGWASPGWSDRVARCEAYCHSHNLKTVRLESEGMENLIKKKKGWPSNRYQFCTTYLKLIPFLRWVESHDRGAIANILIGKRRAESKNRRDTQEYQKHSEYYLNRTIWHPLYLHSNADRDGLVRRSGLELLKHRSLECNPCVNANRSDFLRLKTKEVEKVNRLEVDIAKPMFRPKRYMAFGIYAVMVWAKYGPKRKDIEEVLEDEGCGSPFGCGL